MRITLLVLSLIGLLCAPYSSFAQNSDNQNDASISGYITNSENGETLLFVNVAIEGSYRGVTTNEHGYYNLVGIPEGKVSLVCSFIGFKPFKQELTLKAGENRRLDIELTPISVQLDEVIVEAEGNEFTEAPVSTAKVQTQFIKSLPSAFEADVFRSIQLLPGIKSSSDFSSGLYVRGGSPDQTLILLDGNTVYNPTHFFGFFSTFNPDAIKDVRLYKGGYPSKFGGRLGSVVEVYNKDGNYKRQSGSLSIGTLASRAIVEGPMKKGSYMVAVRRSTLEPLLYILKQNNDNIPDFYFYDANAKVNYNANSQNKLQFAVYAGKDYIDFPFQDDGKFGLEYGNNTINTKWTHLFNNSAFLNISAAYSNYFSTPVAALAGTDFKRDNTIDDFSLKADFQYIPNEKHQFEAGANAGNMLLKLKDSFDSEETFSSRINTQYGSAYVQDKWQPTSKLSLTAGLRANYFAKGDYVRLAPRLNVEYQIKDDFSIQAATGRYYQFLTLITSEAISGFDIWLTTDEGVPPSYGDQFILGFKKGLGKMYRLEVEGYYRYMEDMFELDPFIPDVAGLDYDELFRFGKGFAYGLEMTLYKHVGRLNGFIGYNLATVRKKYPNFNEYNFYPPRYDRLHDLNIVMNYEINSKWSFTSVFSYYTGSAYTEPLGRAVANPPIDNEDYNAIIPGNVNANRLPAYHRMDIGFTYKKNRGFFGLSNDVEWKFQVINVYNRRNTWFRQLDFDENPAKAELVQQLPLLPNISFQAKF